jgi:hypothetical protein
MRPILSLILLSSSLVACNDTEYHVADSQPDDKTVNLLTMKPGQNNDIQGQVTEDDDGNGVVWVDTFQQNQPFDAIDILWVVDRSGSMNDYEADVDQGLSDMFEEVPNIDWRLNMISSASDVVLFDEQQALTKGASIEDAYQMYDGMAQGTSERSFEATMEYVESNPSATEWMRDDAALLIVLVSDEDEQSHSIPTDRFIEWVGMQREQVFVASVVNIDPNVSQCAEREGWHGEMGEFQGDEFMRAAAAFNGMVVDICSDDWSRAMRHATPPTLTHEWPLTHTPLPESIQVFVDGETTSDWSFDVISNQITLDYDPEPSAHVNIAYTTLDDAE